MNSRSSNQTPSAVDRDAEEQLLQHISALHARLSVSVEKLVTPLRDQIIAYKEVVAPLSQDLKKNLAVSWPLLEELQKQDGTLTSAINELENNISKLNSGFDSFSIDSKTSLARAIDLLQNIVESQNQFTASIQEFGANQLNQSGNFSALHSELQTELSSIAQSIADLKSTTTSDLGTNIELLKSDLGDRIASLNETAKALGDSSTSVNADDFEALKFEVQSGMSTIYSSVAELRSQLTSQPSDESVTVLGGLETGLADLRQIVKGEFESAGGQFSTLIEQVSEIQSRGDALQSDEIRAQISKLDWTLQSVGQNVAALGNKLASIQEDVASPPMARRTLKSIEDIDHQIGQIVRALNSGTAIPAADDDAAPPTSTAIGAAIDNIQALLVDIGSQITDALRYYSEEIKRQVAETAQNSLSADDVAGSAFADRASRFAAIEAAALQKMAWQRNPAAKAPAKADSYDETKFEDRLKALDPVTFEKWKPVFRAGAASYADNPNENCATWTSAVARGFRDYLSLFAEGPMLDIGCGPVGIPVYLQGYDPGQIMGIEPLEVKQDAGFDVTRGVAEFLPWPAESFATVICATALDHVMDLERALSEMHRVLKKDGRLVLWYADVPGMADYASTPAADRAAVDNYHLFHIDDVWFQPLLAKWFDVVDMRHIPAGGNVTDVFGVFRPRETVVKDKRPGGSKSKPRPTPARRKPSGTKANPPASDKTKTSAKKTKVKPASAARRKPSGAKAGKPVSSKNASSAKTAALKPSAVAPSAPSTTKADRPASAKSETPAEKTVAKPSVPARKKPARTRAAKSASKPGENGKKPSAAAQSGSAKTTEKSTKT